MKKLYSLLWILLLFLSVSVHAQKYYLGVESGFHKDVYSLSNNDAGDVYIGMDILAITENLSFKILFDNNIEIGTGIGYYNYGMIIGVRNIFAFHTDYAVFYRALSIPLNIGYRFKILPGFYAGFNSGLDFDFYFYDSIYYDTLPGMAPLANYLSIYFPSLKHNFNVLISNKIQLQYVTKFNMVVGIFGAYHAGLRDIWECNDATFVVNNGEKIYNPTITTKGSYWSFGIELGYFFK